MGLFDKLLTPDGKRWSGRQVVWSIDPSTGVLEEAAADQVPFPSQPDEATQDMLANGSDSRLESSFGVREAAKRMGCSTKTIHKLCHDGHLPFHWVGNKRKFRPQDILAFWEASNSAQNAAYRSSVDTRKRHRITSPGIPATPNKGGDARRNNRKGQMTEAEILASIRERMQGWD